VLDVRELHLQALGAAAAVAEVGLAEAFGGDVAELLFAGAGFLGVEEAGGVLRGQGDGQVTDAGVIGGTGRGDETETGAGVDDQAGAGGGLLPGLGPDAGLPALAYRFFKALREVGGSGPSRSAPQCAVRCQGHRPRPGCL
jgi:hypothetical protein